jgi:hypothetical protein
MTNTFKVVKAIKVVKLFKTANTFKVVKVNQGDFNVQQQLMYDYLDSYRRVLVLLCRKRIEFVIKSGNRCDSNER